MKRLLTVLLALLLLCSQAFAITAEDFVVSDQVDDTDKYYFYARMLISDMTLEEKAAQLFAVPAEVWREDMRAGGVMITGKSIVSEAQLKQKTQSMQLAAGEIPLFVMAEEEGGYVSRIAMKLGYDAAAPYGEMAQNRDYESAYLSAYAIGTYLATLGINVNLAPSCELKANTQEDLIPMRYAGEDERVVSGMAVQTVKGLDDAGITAGIKHFTGSGMQVFKDAKDAGAGIVVVSATDESVYDPGIACAFSPVVCENLLRDEVKFEGVVMTSLLSSVGAKDASGQAVMAIKAGCDMLLMPGSYDEALDAVLDAVRNGDITEERINYSVQRIVALKIMAGLID